MLCRGLRSEAFSSSFYTLVYTGICVTSNVLSLVEMFTSSAGNWENSVEFSFVDMSKLPYLAVHFNLQQACVILYLKLLSVFYGS